MILVFAAPESIAFFDSVAGSSSQVSTSVKCPNTHAYLLVVREQTTACAPLSRTRKVRTISAGHVCGRWSTTHLCIHSRSLCDCRSGKRRVGRRSVGPAVTSRRELPGRITLTTSKGWDEGGDDGCIPDTRDRSVIFKGRYSGNVRRVGRITGEGARHSSASSSANGLRRLAQRSNVVPGLIVVRRMELHIKSRDSTGTGIPAHRPVTWFAQLSPEQSAAADAKSIDVISAVRGRIFEMNDRRDMNQDQRMTKSR